MSPQFLERVSCVLVLWPAALRQCFVERHDLRDLMTVESLKMSEGDRSSQAFIRFSIADGKLRYFCANMFCFIRRYFCRH